MSKKRQEIAVVISKLRKKLDSITISQSSDDKNIDDLMKVKENLRRLFKQTNDNISSIIDDDEDVFGVIEEKKDDIDANGDHQAKKDRKSDYEIWKDSQLLISHLSTTSNDKIMAELAENEDVFDFNFEYPCRSGIKDTHTLLMEAAFRNNKVIVNYLLQTGKCDIDKKNNVGDTALDIAARKEHNEIYYRILLSKLNVNLQESIQERQKLKTKLDAMSERFLNFNQITDKDIKIYENYIIDSIQKRKPFSEHILYFIFKYHISNNSLNVFWPSIVKELKQLLDIANISANKLDFMYFKLYLMNSMIWNIEYKKECLYKQIVLIVKAESEKQSKELNHAMNTLIKDDVSSWDHLVGFKLEVVVKRALQRQDSVEDGLTADSTNLSYKELQNISLHSPSNFYPIRVVDYQVYLAQLLVRAHGVNKGFQEEVRKMAHEYVLKDKNCFRAGPVKKWERSVAKAQFDYSLGTHSFPSSAHLIDVIRCSLVFDNLKDYYQCMMDMKQYISNAKSSVVRDIVRIKNGFDPTVSEFNDILKKRFVTYSDVKFNVTVNVYGKVIIGEIQFILAPMVITKRKIHQLYEVERQEEYFVSSFGHMKQFSKEMQFKVALESDNVKELCDLIINDEGNGDYIQKNIELKENETNDPIVKSVRNNCFHNLRFLVYRYGNIIDWEKYNYLLHCCRYLQHSDTFKWLLSSVIPTNILEKQINNECISRSIQFGNYYALQYLINNYRNTFDFEYEIPENKWNYLHYACYFMRDSSVFEWLLNDGIPIKNLHKILNTRDKTGKPPLLRTFFNPNKEIQRILVNKLHSFIDYMITDEFKINLLHYICLHCKVKKDIEWFLTKVLAKDTILKLLNERAGFWPAWQKSGCVPISYSIYFNNQDCIVQLVDLFKNEIDITIEDDDGETMFDHAKAKWPDSKHKMRILFDELKQSKQ